MQKSEGTAASPSRATIVEPDRSTKPTVESRTLVTGFGVFSGVSENPSTFLAENSGRNHELLEVSYRGVRDFLNRLNPDSFDRLLLLGVNAYATKCRVELFARNLIGGQPDVRGETLGPAEIRAGAPKVLGGTLWDQTKLLQPEHLADHPLLIHSFSAGNYLCNYIYFEALMRFRDKKVGFLHVPSTEELPIDRQLEAVREVIEHIENPLAKPV